MKFILSILSIRNIFVRQVATLLAGNGLAQILTIAAAPLLTRLYSPADFGALALFVALFSGVSAGVCGRYEMAVIVAKRQEDRKNLLIISFWFLVAISIFSFLLIGFLVFFGVINSWIDILGRWIWATPFAVFLTGLIMALRAYGNACDDYKALTISTVTQAAATTALAIILSMIFATNEGQLYASIIGLLVTAAFLLFAFRNDFSIDNLKLDRNKFELAILNKEYPLFNAPASILNGVMTALPVFFLARYFSSEIVGHFALLVRVGVVPLSFISDAVSRVNLRKIADLVNENIDPIQYLKSITIVLLVIAGVPSALLMVSAPSVFAWMFGESWREAGVLLVILMPSIAVQFVVSTLSLSFIAVGHHKLQAFWQALSFLISFFIFSIFKQFDVKTFFIAFMVKDLLLYIFYYILLIYALRNPRRKPQM